MFVSEAVPQNHITKLNQHSNHSPIPRRPDNTHSLIYQPAVITYDDRIKDTYTYDSKGNLISFLTQIWSNNNWVNSYLSTRTYNISGKILSEYEQYWETNAWVNSQELLIFIRMPETWILK